MPTRPPHPCRHPRCPALTQGRYCPPHQREHQQRQDQQRGTATERGYGPRWQKYRARFLAEHPLCEMECKREGRLTPATVVDHIKPHKGDHALFWDPKNHQAACKPCHDRKTAREDGGFGRSASPPPTRN